MTSFLLKLAFPLVFTEPLSWFFANLGILSFSKLHWSLCFCSFLNPVIRDDGCILKSPGETWPHDDVGSWIHRKKRSIYLDLEYNKKEKSELMLLPLPSVLSKDSGFKDLGVLLWDDVTGNGCGVTWPLFEYHLGILGPISVDESGFKKLSSEETHLCCSLLTFPIWNNHICLIFTLVGKSGFISLVYLLPTPS